LKKALHSTDDICASQPKLRQPVKAEIRAETLGLFFGNNFFAQETETILKSKRAILSVLTDESLSLSHPNPSSLYLPKVD
jgi:hypothetical protein